MSVTDVDLSAFDTPGRGRGLLDVFRRRYLLRLLVRKGTATRYRNSVLGWTWSYVKPGVQFFVYFFIIGIVLNAHRDVQYFPVYLFSGLILVNFFNEAFGNATTAIVENRALVRKIYLPRELFPVSAIIVALIHFLPQAAILLVIVVILGWVPTLTSVAIAVAGLALMATFALGLGMMFGAVNVRFRDAQNFVEIIRMVAIWSTPTIYTWGLMRDVLPQWAFNIYFSNPLAIGVEMYHEAFWAPVIDGTAVWPPNALWNIVAAVTLSLLTVVVGQLMFRHFERSFAQDL
ncbi:ABC transporter permease [Aeromicrobium piscarium]|uniref:Transport permease protein n=1 Tax=Aeromicrobium piscarium TaxID=2590901 RepID=A0A554SH09_9ACTN|nr:ABC transporter permease [Aeromicrobium piscarium]TSD65606.1 ABC transporter permease [Aeromicrobium piscarium]